MTKRLLLSYYKALLLHQWLRLFNPLLLFDPSHSFFFFAARSKTSCFAFPFLNNKTELATRISDQKTEFLFY
jgi:hypothetical protein